MALRHEDMSPEGLDRQSALDRSWCAARKSLANPKFRADLDSAIERVNVSDAEPITGEDFLEQTEPSKS